MYVSGHVKNVVGTVKLIQLILRIFYILIIMRKYVKYFFHIKFLNHISLMRDLHSESNTCLAMLYEQIRMVRSNNYIFQLHSFNLLSTKEPRFRNQSCLQRTEVPGDPLKHFCRQLLMTLQNFKNGNVSVKHFFFKPT